MENTYTQPIDRAKEIFHKAWKKPLNNFYMAKDEAIYLINMLLEEAEYSNNLQSVEYWKQVLQAAINL